MSRILVVEDEQVIRSELARLLARSGHEVVEAGSVPEALSAGASDGFDLVVADLRLPGELGTTLIDVCRTTPVLVMTSYATVRAAVEAMQKGAADFVAKPFDHDEFLLVVDRVLRQSRLQRQNAALKQDLERNYAVQGMVGSCPAMREVFDRVRKVSGTDATVLILGESGTGKELVARAVHDQSSRHDAPIITVNCASIPETLIESELFGHEKGAFTGATNARRGAFEEADGGTLFLDEIGELPLDLQAKLLRALESGEIKRVGASRPTHVDVRIVAASNRDLLAACRAPRLRDDLYYRLCVIPLHLAPLRNRRGDVLALAEHFVRLFSPRGQQVGFTPSAIDRLQTHSWPGNIRELRNAVHRALLLRRGPMIDAADLSYDQEVNPETGITVPELPRGMTLEQMLEKLERQIVETALRRYNNNRERVAKELGVARSTLFKRLKDWGLTRKDEPWPEPPAS